jgi:hypothetical protein
MPALDRLLQKSGLQAQEISRLRKAYDLALREIGVKDRDDPLAEIVARKIIEIGQTGIKDPAEISRLAVERLGVG